MKDIKTKPKYIKKKSNVKTAKRTVPVSAVDKLKKQYIKSKAEMQKQSSQQTERPENYAVDEIEDKSEQAVYTSVDMIRQSARYVKDRVQKYNANDADIPVQDSSAQEVPKQHTVPKIKTKEKYLKHKNSAKNNIYKLKVNIAYKPKMLQAVQAKNVDVKISKTNNKTQVARKYIQDKIRTQNKVRKITENRNADVSNITINKSTLTTTVRPQEHIKVKKSDIKTKENYIQTHYIDKADINTKQNVLSESQKPVIKQKRTNSTNTTLKHNEPKTANHKVKKTAKRAVKTQKKVAKQNAKQTAKRSRQLAERSAQVAKETSKAVARFTLKIVHAVKSVAVAIGGALVALGGWAVLLVVLIIVIIIAAIAASPFGIFFSEEANDVGTIPLSQIIAECNIELTQKIEDIELSVPHTEVELICSQADVNEVIAVFAAKTAGVEDDTAEDVVVFDETKAEKLKEVFRTANMVRYEVKETKNADGEVETTLTIIVEAMTKEELMTAYVLTEKQQEAVETLLEHGDILTSSSQSLAITDANVQAIIDGLSPTMPEKRRDVVKNAASLVGKVNYFWGGKSSAIGWDPRWGSMQRVTAAGSPSSGTIRAFGLDCSGFVTWAFINSNMGSAVGHGTLGQKAASTLVSASTVQAGDLAFLPSYSHVGIVVGKDKNGNSLVIHCSSSANNVVLSTASSVGFTVFRRPNCY